MKITTIILVALICAAACFAQAPATQAPAGAPQAQGDAGRSQATPDNRPGVAQARQARQAANQGNFDEAITLFQQALQTNPQLMEAEMGWGSVLDLKGDYAGARKHLANAIELAKPEQKVGALRSMGVSYAFTNDCKNAARYDQQAFDSQVQKPDYIAAAETANELARICIEAGDLDAAHKWYQAGHDTAMKKTDLSDADKDLWNFRWEHALARIAARRGQKSEADKHVAAAKAILDRGVIDKAQQAFFPYLTGYVAFYAKDYKTAIADLQQANQRDPFILSLEAQAYEKSGDKAKADDLYKQVLSMNIHNPTGAFARPLAKQKLGMK